MVYPSTVFLRGQEAGTAQDLEVTRQLVLGFEQTVDKLAQTGFLIGGCQQPDNAKTSRLAERFKALLNRYFY